MIMVKFKSSDTAPWKVSAITAAYKNCMRVRILTDKIVCVTTGNYIIPQNVDIFRGKLPEIANNLIRI